MIQRNLQAQVITIRTNRGSKFLNKTLNANFKEERIEHQTSTPLLPEQNDIVERQNRTLVEAARMMLSTSKHPLPHTTTLSQQELGLLFGPLYDEFFTAGTLSVNKFSYPSNNSKQQDTPPIATAQSTTESITPTTTVTAEENNTDNQAEIQVDNAHVDDNEFYNVISTPVREEAESSSYYVDPSNMHIFYPPHQSEHRWTKDHPLSQVRGNPSKPVETR
ncbi:retrovirus-related pol polyprotein from transposon TNT 1-94 [Tanacetum coccineum]